MSEEPAVRLSSAELLVAASVGITRHLRSLAKGLRDSHGKDSDNGWQAHIEGACGECALAKFLGVYWDPTVDTFKHGGDVGALQVRTRSKHEYALIIRDDDRDSDMFVLLTGIAPAYVIRGWIRGTDGKRAEFREAYGGRPPAYFVPQQELRPLDSLTAVLAMQEGESYGTPQPHP